MMISDTSELLKDKNVLLIESDEVNRMLIGYMITDQGANLTVEARQEKVVDIIRQQKTDLIILDTSMDNVNALEFTQMLRQQMDVQVPIIGLSAHDLRGRGIYHGLDAVLSKPVEYQELKSLLQQLQF